MTSRDRAVAKRKRSGFTLVELLVVITIIGILIALLLPAVQAARAAARRMQCSNNLKQLALAIHNFHAAHDVMPENSNNYGYTGGNWNQPGPGQLNTKANGFSWIAMILPYIEQNALYDQFDFSVSAVSSAGSPSNRELMKTPIADLVCPSDPATSKMVRFASELERNWAKSAGGQSFDNEQVAIHTYFGVAFAEEPVAGPIHLFHYTKYNNAPPGNDSYPIKRQSVSFRDVTDGLSNTLCLSEESFDCSRMTWATSIGSYVNPARGINAVKRAVGHSFPSDCVWLMAYTGLPYSMHSYHSQGVNCALADGSVRFLSETMNEQIILDLAHMKNGAPIGGLPP